MRSVVVAALLVVFAALVASVAEATFVRIEDSRPICFAEDVTAASEIVVVEFNRPSLSHSNNIAVHVKATSPDTKTVVYTGRIKVGTGSFTFKPVLTENGAYDICIFISSADYKVLSETKAHIDVGLIIDHHSRRVSLSQPDPDITRTKVGKGNVVMQFTDSDGNQMETLRSVDFVKRINKLLEDVRHATRDIDEEVSYITQRGRRMRQTSEALFARVWTFALMTMFAMVAVGYMQFQFLTSFLKRKKLV